MLLVVSAVSLPAHADRLDDDLATVWESVWDQRGWPVVVQRWEQPLRFKFIGRESARNELALLEKLMDAAQLERAKAAP